MLNLTNLKKALRTTRTVQRTRGQEISKHHKTVKNVMNTLPPPSHLVKAVKHTYKDNYDDSYCWLGNY